jgi:uncharacterized membrane protein
MFQDLHAVSPLLAALGSGVVAGVFFAFSSFVMPALARLPPAQGIAAMQSINVTAVAPPFMGVFFGTAGLTLAAAVPARGAWLLWVGSALYVLGVIGVTVVCNVPRNNALAAVAPTDADAALLWARYLSEWTAWNHVRTAAALGATVAFILALGSR